MRSLRREKKEKKLEENQSIKKAGKKAKKEVIEFNPALSNIITPMGAEIKMNSIRIGENFAKIYSVVKYPQTVDYGWLSKLTNIPGTVASILFTPIDNSGFAAALSTSVLQNRGKAESIRDPRVKKRCERAAADGERIMIEIDQHNETVGQLSINVMPMNNDEDGFKKLCKRVESSFVIAKCRIRPMAALQKEGFKMVSPFYTGDKEINHMIKAVMQLSTFVGGFPFASSGFNDPTGYLYGKDANGGLVIIDPWIRGNDRTNSNFVIMGVPGQGKSAGIKNIILMEYALGTKIIFIDPEREYKELTEKLNGDWINAGGDGNGCLNPLQIRKFPEDDDGDSEVTYKKSGGMGAMALHMKMLDSFFSLYFPEITDTQRAILKDLLIKLYNQFNIFWETDVQMLKNTDFPIFKDLYELILVEIKEANDLEEKRTYKNLAVLLKDIAIGSDSFLWGKHTTLETKTRCICLDTHDLVSSSNIVKRSQYYNLLTWVWEVMSANRHEKVMAVFDEAYLLIDPEVPQSLVFLRDMEKRARKYEASVVVASHSVVDFLDPKVKMYGQALIDLPCYKILMGTDGKNLEETKKLYNLTEAEEEVLGSKKQGNCLFVAGSKRFNLKITIPQYKFDYMGDKGGR